MRAFVVAVALVAAAPAAAGVMDQDRWSAGTVERRGRLVLTTTLAFERTAPGEWRVRAQCQTNDTRTGKWFARKADGVAVRSMGLVLMDLPPMGRMVLNTASLALFGNIRSCGEGTADLGTGD